MELRGGWQEGGEVEEKRKEGMRLRGIKEGGWKIKGKVRGNEERSGIV